MPPAKNLVGQRFGSLTAQARTRKDSYGAWMWVCTCDCGTGVEVRASTLTAGRTSACASCAATARATTHGMSDQPLYRRWQAMKARCGNPNNKHYSNYGGRGITVCARWLAFENFAADMGATFRPDLELDRIDVEGNYEPQNCRWADRITQQRNRRNNAVLTHRGESHTVAEWAERLGVKPNTLTTRIRRGWAPERVLLELANGGAS